MAGIVRRLIRSRPARSPLRASRLCRSDALASDTDALQWASETDRLQLLDLVTARSQQCEQTIGPTHVTRANDHKIRLAAAQVLFNFRKPAMIPHVDKASAQGRKITKRVADHSGKSIGVAMTPRVQHVVT